MEKHKYGKEVTFTRLDWDITERALWAAIEKTHKPLKRKPEAGQTPEDLECKQILCLIQGEMVQALEEIIIMELCKIQDNKSDN